MFLKNPIKVICVLKYTQQFKTLNPMQQVPAVEIDGITLSQSVSPQTIHPGNHTKPLF